MALLAVKPLDAADSYLRWKESVLLRLHTVGVAYVLSQAGFLIPVKKKSVITDKSKYREYRYFLFFMFTF